jgi:hypothetical protein
MGIAAGIQTIWALVYFFMAQTEMFFGPLTQAWTYMLVKSLGSLGKAEDVEKLVRVAVNSDPSNKANFLPNYWDYHHLVTLPNAPDLATKINDIAISSGAGGWLDPLFQAIPSFTVVVGKDGVPHPQPYLNALDYMVSNRWCFDFITFSNRTTPGLEKAVSGAPYPLPVPDVDWIWMLLGLAATIACVVIAGKMKAPAQPAKTASPAPTASATH